MDDKTFWNDAYRQDPRFVDVADHFLDAELQALTPGSALDLGCGSGANVLKLAAQGWAVVGVDWAEKAIAMARKAAQERQIDATFVVGDTTVWQPPQKFDLVISTYALPGGEASRQVLQTAVAALAPGGTLLVAEWDRSMHQAWGLEAEELPTPDQIAAMLPGLEIEQAAVRHLEDAFPAPDDPRRQAGAAANVAFVRARKP